MIRQYGAGEPLSCDPLSTGLLNHGYRLVTTRGHYFLKNHLADTDSGPRPAPAAAPAGPTAEDTAPALGTIVRQHRATARLAALGLPVVPPLADAGGRTVVVLDGRAYALHPWIEGRHRDGAQLTTEQSRRLGTLLGQVHTCLARVMGTGGRGEHPTGLAGPGAPGRVPGGPFAPADPADTKELIAELLVRIRARTRPDAFDRLAEHRLVERRALLRRYADRRPAAGSAPPEGWVHGDFHPLNLLYREADPVAIVDWDRLAVRPCAEETVRGAAIFFVRPDGSLDLPKVRAYARAYRQAARASADELCAAVHRVWWERLNDFWTLRWRYQLRDTRADPLFPALSALAVWWTRHYEEVRTAFSR
ncbi:phosphotransferase [Streptomyces sp. HNM0574]|uniref:phosphotransferase n=1 Tax=Streptomyces sp. HNM0574 TaxID=2714954 RepID=UPI00146EBB87|nr:phosphotransferase [Streptomyces sp. HNM0574]NLU68636.1 phosphotransferase [Streptomyces sp. HNM0574]